MDKYLQFLSLTMEGEMQTIRDLEDWMKANTVEEATEVWNLMWAVKTIDHLCKTTSYDVDTLFNMANEQYEELDSKEA